MPKLDPLTLWMANCVILAFAALVWALLGSVYRIAPRATALFCAASLMSLPALSCNGCAAPWSSLIGNDWQRAGAALLAVLLIERGVRRLLHAERRTELALAACVLALLGAGAGFAGQAALAFRLLAGTTALLAGATVLLLYRGTVDASHQRAARLALCLPVAGIALDYALAALAGAAPVRTDVLSQLTPVALQLWIALSLMVLAVRRLWLRVEHLARHDPLTGLLNRRALMEALGQARARQRRGLPFAWIVMDIDHFKQVNDALGHAGGDAALRHIAELLRKECRSSDALARLGGEEFGLLLPGSGLAEAIRLAERLRQALQAAPLHWQGQSWPLRASFGVTVARSDDDAVGERLLQRADAWLYQAKSSGRDRVLGDTETVMEAR